MSKRSAGLLAYRWKDRELELFLVHMGGPFFSRKDEGGWSIPKGEIEEGEEPFHAARREFEEETGFVLPAGEFLKLAPRTSSGKTIHAWAFGGDFDPGALRSNRFTMEWPPGSGRLRSFPEADRAGWFSLEQALVKIVKGQKGFVEELAGKREQLKYDR